MKVLFVSTSSNNTDTVIGSLDSLGEHEIEVFRYDEKWHRVCAELIQQNSQVRDLLNIGMFPPPEQREGFRRRVARDAELLDVARRFQADAIVYISAWEGLFVPTHETLGELNTISPVVHMCFDGADPPWWPQLEEFEKKGLFSLTVNIDGSFVWPGGQGKLTNALTLLTPLDPRPFVGVQVPFAARPYPMAYAGNAGGWIRNYLVQRMQHELTGFAFKQRDDHSDSYKNFCDFLRHSKAVVSVGFTGSNATMHVKGRVLEAGYAGTALLEWSNPATRAWFTPRYEYDEYDTVEEGIEVAEFLINHPKRCEQMAAALHDRVTREHSAEVFWFKVFTRLGKK